MKQHQKSIDLALETKKRNKEKKEKKRQTYLKKERQTYLMFKEKKQTEKLRAES